MSNLSYPAALETFWLNRAAANLQDEDQTAALDQLRPDVAKLSDLFTIDRPADFGRYGDEARAQLAYGLFFFPQTYIRTRLVLDECLRAGCWTPPAGRPIRILDLGAGLGAALLAAAHTLAPRAGEYCALDHSTGSLATLRELFVAENIAVETRVAPLLEKFPAGETWDLILCSFALNEALQNAPDTDVAAWTRRLLDHLAPGGLLVLVEPALESAALRLETLRDALATEGHGRIVAPCLHHLPCPLRREGRNFCHEVRRWTPPESAAYINRRLFRDLSVLKFCFLAVSNEPRTEPQPSRARARLISPVDTQNGKLVVRGCAADGQLYTYETLTRHLTRAEKDAFAQTERGTRADWSVLKSLPDGCTLRSEAPPKQSFRVLDSSRIFRR